MLFTNGLFKVEIAKGYYYGEERLAAAVRQRIGIPAKELFAQVLDQIQQACALVQPSTRARWHESGRASSDNW
jgi:hypothetical protein